MIFITFSVALIILALTYHVLMEKQVNVPKGFKELPIERGLPIFGIIFEIKRSMTFHCKELGRKLGPLFAIRLGMRDIVILNNYDVIKKALMENSDVFSGRFEPQFKKQVIHDSGFTFIDGKTWSEHRSFMNGAFRELGIGKFQSEEIIQNECTFLLQDLKSLEGKCVNAYNFFSLYIANVISSFVIGKRRRRGNEEMRVLSQIMKDTVQSQERFELLSLLFPLLNTNFLFIKLSIVFTSLNRLFQKVFETFQHEIDEHLKTLNSCSPGDDVMEKYIIKQCVMKRINGTVQCFTDNQLIMIAYELIGAGFETLSTFMEWSCMFLSKYPDIQKTVYNEIVEHVGCGRMIMVKDKRYLHYTQSVIDEILRMSTLSPFSIPHRTLTDTSIDGFFIRKDSIVFPNLYNCHYDPEVWENPMQFNPNRFVTMQNDGHMRYTPRKELIPFSIGKRRCPGQSLARMEHFIFLTNILQNFEISFAQERTDEKFKDSLFVDGNIVRACLIKDYIFKSRFETDDEK